VGVSAAFRNERLCVGLEYFARGLPALSPKSPRSLPVVPS